MLLLNVFSNCIDAIVHGKNERRCPIKFNMIVKKLEQNL